MSDYAFPKPKDQKHEPVHTRTYDDGRIVHNLLTAEGRRRYYATLEDAYQKQKHLCPICHRFIAREDLSPDHYKPRGMGGATRDDRPENIVAVHAWCNSKKGSQRDYYEKPR